MGHAHHFLSRLDRVSHDEVELSLGLYNNAPLVKHILARSGLPPRAERVAISLDDRSEGPFLIVTREGRFVTCLGRGMRHEHPVVRRWQLDLLAERHEELKACMRPAERVPEGERAVGRLLDRILGLGDGLSREAFLDLAPLQPLMFPHYIRCLYDVHGWLSVARHRLRHLERPRPRDHDELERLWQHLWAMKHLCALLGVGDPVEYYADRPREAVARVTTTVTAVAGEHVAFCLSAVAAWATARFGGAFLPVCGHRFERSPHSVVVRQSGLELAAVAGAHPRLRGAVLAAMRGLQPRHEVAARGRCDDVERGRVAARVVDAFARTDDLDVRAALWGAKRLFDTEHPAVARHGWRTVHDVPVEVAMPCAVDIASDWLHRGQTVAELYHLTPSIARYRPEELYVPERWLPAMRDPWSPERSMSYLAALRGYYLKKEPVVTHKAPGRNEPCACGSGVKYKRCCAAAKAPLVPAVEHPADVPTLADGIWPRASEKAARSGEHAALAGAANDDALGPAEAPANDGADARAVA